MKIEINDIVSSSATKGQQANAKIMFGKNATKVLKALEMYSKEKQLPTNGIDAVLAALKTKDTAALEKFANSASGKKLASNCLKLANAKTPAAMFTALKPIKETATLAKMGGLDTSSENKVTRKPKESKPVDYKDLRSVLSTIKKQLRITPEVMMTKGGFNLHIFSKGNSKMRGNTEAKLVVKEYVRKKIMEVFVKKDGTDLMKPQKVSAASVKKAISVFDKNK